MIEVVFPALHAGQREVAKHPARFKVLAAGRRWRKTSLGVQLCLSTSLGGGRTWWVAPSYPMAAIGWRMARHLARQIPLAEIREAEKLIVFPTRGELQVKSADNPDSLRGSGLNGVVLDEAAYAQEAAWKEALRPALSDRQGWALFISTPSGLNWFHELYEQAATADGWACWQFPTWSNPHIAPEEIEAARRELGDVIFRQEYGAEFLEEARLRPFRAAWLTYWSQEPGARPADPMVIEAGFDPAISKREGACRSALVVAGQVREGSNRGLINVLRAVAGHWSVYESVDVLIKAVRELGVRTVRIEDVQYQRGLGEVLEHEARLRRIAVHVDLVRPDADKVRRAHSWSALVEDGTVRFGPEQDDLTHCMLAVPPEKPEDQTKWDPVDAAGLCVRGFPRLAPETAPLPGKELTTPTVAESYATRPDDAVPHATSSRPKLYRPPGSRMAPVTARRAAGYAVGRK